MGRAKPPASLFRELNAVESFNFRQWARENFHPGGNISPVWHPAVQAECKKMEEEAEHAEL